MMAKHISSQLSQIETTCGSLLYELQTVWDEVGESDAERDQMLFELEQECLELYRRKVDQANRSRARLRQTIADSEAELAAICSAMGEGPVHLRQCNQSAGSLKEVLNAIVPQLEEMQKRKNNRRNQFLEVMEQIQSISSEINSADGYQSMVVVDDSDLSIRRLEDLKRQMQSLQQERADRLNKVLDHLDTLNSLCAVLGMDYKQTVHEINPSLHETEGSKNVSNDTIDGLVSAIQRLREIKIQRMQRLQDLVTAMLEMWNLMDTPIEEQQMFQNVTCNIAASEHEITEPNSLSVDFINNVETEVLRLEELKASKMKELVVKKKTELEELLRRTHLVGEEASNETEFSIEAVETGSVDPSFVLEQIEVQISIVKEEAFSRKEILERLEKWLAACEEESWLEEYNRDENRYNAGRGAHLTLKRAEKARLIVNKLPAMVEALVTKTTAWEKDRGIEFTYDGVHLLSMLEEYNILRQEKEQERKRQRDQKRVQGQLIAEQEVLYGSKPSPSKSQSTKKMLRTLTMGPNRRQSLGGAFIQPQKSDLLHSTKSTSSTKKADAAAAFSAGRRDQDVGSLSAKELPFIASNAREPETPRKPFSPLAPVNSMLSIPSQTNSVDAGDDNKTPKAAPIIAPKTPTTVSAPMQMATTPAPVSLAYEAADTVVAEAIEQSFEERRLALLLKG